MARSHSFWMIIDGAVPTAFRAKKREDLLPTLTQLKRTRPSVVLMWFERGRVWESPAAAREALEARRRENRPRDRKPEWRPGGEHRDPRAKYQLSRDEKRARFKKRQSFGRDDRKGPPTDARGPRQFSDTGGGWRKRTDDRPRSDARPRDDRQTRTGDRSGWKPQRREGGGWKSRSGDRSGGGGWKSRPPGPGSRGGRKPRPQGSGDRGAGGWKSKPRGPGDRKPYSGTNSGPRRKPKGDKDES